METKSVAQRAIALITERGAIRTDQIAEALGLDKAAIASSLGAYVNNGTLVTCKVERPGWGMAVNEYRISAGGKALGFREYKVKDAKSKKTPPVPVPPAAAAAIPAKAKPAKKRSAPVRKVQRNTAIAAKRPHVARKAVKLPKVRAAPSMYESGTATAGAFRTAIASDGAMIFLGAAAGPFELTRPESRALIEFVRTLDRGEVGA